MWGVAGYGSGGMLLTPEGGPALTPLARARVGAVDGDGGGRDARRAGGRVRGRVRAGVQGRRAIDGLFKLAFVEDPWGTKIEVVEDTEWLGFHHLHLRSTDPAAALDWYENIFEGERDSLKGRIAGLRYGTVWLLISRHEGELAPTEGRAFDHLGWQFPDLRAAAEEIKGKGVEFNLEPRPFTNPLGQDMLISFVTGPDGVRIEIVQPQA